MKDKYLLDSKELAYSFKDSSLMNLGEEGLSYLFNRLTHLTRDKDYDYAMSVVSKEMLDSCSSIYIGNIINKLDVKSLIGFNYCLLNYDFVYSPPEKGLQGIAALSKGDISKMREQRECYIMPLLRSLKQFIFIGDLLLAEDVFFYEGLLMSKKPDKRGLFRECVSIITSTPSYSVRDCRLEIRDLASSFELDLGRSHLLKILEDELQAIKESGDKVK